MKRQIQWPLALCFTITACSLGEMQLDSPPWVQDASQACPGDSLCALGEGISHREAEHNARESLAKIFETRVQGTTEAIATEARTRYQRESLQTFDEILQGVHILRRHRRQNTFYALAALHKKKSAQLMLQKMNDMDALLLQYYGEGNPGAFLKTWGLRQLLQDRHFLLTGRTLSPKIRYDKMRKKMATIQAFRSHQTILLQTPSQPLRRLLVENLNAQGYRTSDQASAPYQLKLVAQLSSRQLHFNVPGFKKYEFSLQIKMYNPQGIQQDMLSLSMVQAGRSEQQAWALAMKNILMGLEKKIDTLLKEKT